MGAAIGSVVHNQVAALVGTLVWLFLVETLLVGLFSLLDVEGLAEYLLHALDGADGTGATTCSPTGRRSPSPAAGSPLLGAAGVGRTRRRDIT